MLDICDFFFFFFSFCVDIFSKVLRIFSDFFFRSL